MTAVRPLGITDERVWRDLFTAYGVFYKTDFTDDVLDRVWALLIADGSGVDALIATDDSGAVIGFAHYRSHPDTFTGNRDWFLDDLYVRPEARGMGGATTLIEALRDSQQRATACCAGSPPTTTTPPSGSTTASPSAPPG